jgi:YD repeat-containing protein
MSDGSGQTAWSYDAGGSVLAERRTISGITKSTTYTYNLAGSVASITYPTGHVVSYGYNNAGRQISVTDSGSGINYALSATYAPQGAIAGAVHGQVSGGFTGITRTYAYNNRLEPNTKVASSSNGTVQNLTYSFNLGGGVNNGNVASITNNVNANRTQSYTYDSQNRLGTAQSQAASGVDCWGQSFGYDQYGNLLSITATKCSAPSLSVSVNNSNQITNTGFTYDAAGNMTNDGSQAYAWDADNRLTSGAGTTYTYDGDGWRRKSSVGKLYWNDSGCGNPVLMETDLTGGSAQEFIYLNKQRIARREASGTILYYFDDHLESARVMTDATGHTMQESDYYPYWRGAGDHRHAGQPLQVQREAARLGDGSGP